MTIRCVHVIHSLEPGGAERVLVDLAAAAPQGDLEVSVVSLSRIRDERIAAALAQARVSVHVLDLATRWDPRAFLRCWRLLAALRPDVTHTHLKHADLVGGVVSRLLAIPVVSTLHLIEDAPRGLDRVKRGLAAAARTRVAARTITVSDAQRRWYLATFDVDPSRVITIHNGARRVSAVPSEERVRLRARLGLPERGAVAAMVAIMRPGKGHDDLLAALQLVPRDVDLRVVLAGDGPLRGELERRARAAGLVPSRVVFAGFVDDVAGLLAASDVVVQPSHFDALPTALIQALAAGLPVVATDVGGIPEIITPEVGVLVPPGDVQALAGALVDVAADSGLRQSLGAAARQRFDSEFDAGVWAGRLSHVYQEVLLECAASR